MKPATTKTFTHVASFALAFALAALIGGSLGAGSKQAATTRDSTASSSAISRPDRPDRPGRPAATKRGERDAAEPGLRSKDYKAAWDAIGFRNVTVQERSQLQRMVLAEWAETDLEGAMKAALASTWDGERGEGTVENLLWSFNAAFGKRPLEAWDIIQSGRLGLGASLLENQWVSSTVHKDPMLVMSVFEDLPARSKGNTLSNIASMAKNDPAMRAEFLAKLGKLPQTEQYSSWVGEVVKVLGPTGTPAEIALKLSEATTDQQKTLFIHEFGASLRDADAASMKAEWSKLPADLQARAARSLLHHADASKNIPQIMDLFVETADWKSLGEQASKLKDYARQSGNPAEVAAWAMKLPERPETTQLFHRAIEPYIQSDPAGARSWIESMPAQDWRRDRALAEYSQQQLWKIRNEQESRWALDQISNPTLKAEATKWRADWARQTGSKP